MQHGKKVIAMSTAIIVLTGPESSGKTTLARQLTEYWKAPLVEEVARDYLKRGTSYQQHDLLEIAKLQYRKEQAFLSHFPEKLICDTDLLVMIVWSEVKYGRCDQWIYDTFEKCLKQEAFSRHYYLCDSEIPWQADDLRENPDNRKELFKLYLQKLREYELDYNVVRGDRQERVEQVLNSLAS